VVGYWGDFLVYVTTNSNAGTTRYGDYVSIRRDGTDPSTFVAFGYGLTATTDQHYVRFSRPQQPPPR
jgi:hypothetical protein